MLDVRKREVGGERFERDESRMRTKPIGNLAFSFAALVVLLHKYSSYLFDTISLKVKFHSSSRSRTVVLNYAPGNDEMFVSILRAFEKMLSRELKPFREVDNIQADIEWIPGDGGGTGRLTCQVNSLGIHKLLDVRFLAAPTALFEFIFMNSEAHYRTIFNYARFNSMSLVRDIPCFLPEELNEIENIAHGPGKEFTQSAVHELFEKTADHYPDRTAVCHNGVSINYRQLNERANHLAHFLIQHEVKPGDFVGLLLDRSPEAYIGMLGILKSGAAYVPLDSEFPNERIQFILKDSSAKFLVTSNELKEKHHHLGVRTIDIHSLTQKAQSEWLENPQLFFDIQSPAYVIYTSGSTGLPKGVIVSHAAVNNLVGSEREIFGLTPDDRVLQGFSLAFDASVEEVWLAFLSGATLYPASKELMCWGEGVTEFINDLKITALSTVPTLLSTMNAGAPSLRLLILGGEACSTELLQRWHRENLRIVNTYGPTEATVIATFADFNPENEITIGRPIHNCSAFIVNQLMQPVPKGVPGELCIAGRGLASGYLNRKELTGEKFVCIQTGDRQAYRSGDLAMFNTSGELVFLGRIDSQVKLRGYRIELPEIESQILSFANIKNAVVAVREDVHKVERLIAYVILKDPSLGFDELGCKELLKRKLAPYMVPSLFIEMKSFPVLPSGKIERKKLPTPEDSPISEDRLVEEPHNETEKQIYEVWKKYFAPHQVSATDNFFLDLGGHSLLAAKMVSELRQRPDFQSISVVDVYRNPTIQKLAKELSLRISQGNGHDKPIDEKLRHIPKKIVHFFCGLGQFLSLYFVFAFSSITSATGYFVFFYFLEDGRSWIESTAWALPSAMLVYPLVILLAIGLKWLFLGRIKPGRYKLWGWFYFRWWFMQNVLRIAGLRQFTGTTLLPFIYRLLGARIGKGVHIGTDHLAAFDLTSIGDGTTVDDDVRLSGHSIKDGYLVIDSITIGKRCRVGERSVVNEGTVMEDDARIEDLSLLPTGTHIPSGETWAGSPARFMQLSPVPEPPPAFSAARRVGINLLYVGLIFVIPIISFISFIPGISILFQFSLLDEPLTYLAILPVVGASFVLMLTVETVIIKWLLVGKVKPGKYPVHGSFYVRNWIIEQLLKLSLDYAGQLHATLYIAPWYRALGMKIGKSVELSTATSSSPDLIELADGSTVADEASLGTPHIERGWMTAVPTKLGKRAFLGNSGVVPGGTEMGDGTLVGVLSIAPSREESRRANATWFGSPSILFPKREASIAFGDEKTYSPPTRIRIARAAFELLRVTLPPAGFSMVTVSMITMALEVWEQAGLAATLALLPLVFGASSLVIIVSVAIIKWLVMGRYKPFVYPLWSTFVWRLELVNALFEFLTAPLMLEFLQGTPFLPWYLRLLGSKIGKRCYIGSTGFLEWDMVEIGDRTAIGEDAVMQTHLFEDRVLKASPLKVGSDCSIGEGSVVLYDTVMKDGSHLDSLSLLMKGEILPAGTEWRGIPALRGSSMPKESNSLQCVA